MKRSRIGGCLFLALSLFYGYAATGIPSLPIDEFESMNARSLPFFLCGTGTLLSLILIFFPTDEPRDKDGEGKLLKGEWGTVVSLIVAILGYALALEQLGFLLSTATFLAVGFLILGERRWRVVCGLSLALVGTLWLILVPGLDIYLAPGRLISLLFG